MPALRALCARHTVVGVVTQPDRPSGRGMKLTPTPVARLARELGLHVLTPVKPTEILDDLRALSADAFVVASYGRILPASVLAIPPRGSFNIHPSMLPLYRGATPIPSAIADGRSETAVTIIMMDTGMDTGDIVAQRTVAIEPDEVASKLHDRLADIGAEMLIVAIADDERGELHRRPQAGLALEDEIRATLTRPFTTTDTVIDWTWNAERIVNFVRSLADRPGARADLGGERIKVLACARPIDSRTEFASSLAAEIQGSHTPGTILGTKDHAAIVACAQGEVLVQIVVPPNKNARTGAAFARDLATAAK